MHSASKESNGDTPLPSWKLKYLLPTSFSAMFNPCQCIMNQNYSKSTFVVKVASMKNNGFLKPSCATPNWTLLPVKMKGTQRKILKECIVCTVVCQKAKVMSSRQAGILSSERGRVPFMHEQKWRPVLIFLLNYLHKKTILLYISNGLRRFDRDTLP